MQQALRLSQQPLSPLRTNCACKFVLNHVPLFRQKRLNHFMKISLVGLPGKHSATQEHRRVRVKSCFKCNMLVLLRADAAQRHCKLSPRLVFFFARKLHAICDHGDIAQRRRTGSPLRLGYALKPHVRRDVFPYLSRIPGEWKMQCYQHRNAGRQPVLIKIKSMHMDQINSVT